MSYDIVKGWPAPGALDVNLSPASGNVFVGGEVASLNSSGAAELASYATDGSNAGEQAFFVIGVDNLNGGITALKSGMIIEVDADHYAAAAYAANDALSATDGKFVAVSGTAKEVARVLSYNAVTGILRVVWTAVA